MLAVVLLLQLSAPAPDTIVPRVVARAPAPGEPPDSAHFGPPQARLRTGQGSALVWLARAADSVYVVAAIDDATPSPADALVISLNTGGERGARPGQADFQWVFRRVLDSSVVYRGRSGRWEAPRSDPDWRLGTERSGGGWTVTSAERGSCWWLVLRLDPAWLDGIEESRPAIAFGLRTNRFGEWSSWPEPPPGVRPLAVSETPTLWVPVAR